MYQITSTEGRVPGACRNLTIRCSVVAVVQLYTSNMEICSESYIKYSAHLFCCVTGVPGSEMHRSGMLVG